MSTFEHYFFVFVLGVWALMLNQPVHAQTSRLYLGTQVPLNYSVGFETQLTDDLSLNAHAGVLTTPYDKAIVEVLKALGSDEALANTIEDEFDIGYHLQPSVKYYFRNTYLAVSYIYQSLWARDLSRQTLENYYGVQLPFRPFRTNRFTLNSQLHNLGFYVGRVLDLGLDNWWMHLEGGVYKTIHSKSQLSSEYGEMDMINPLVEKELGEYFRKYGYLVSVNIYLVYRF